MRRESPVDVVNLMSFRARFLARPASVGIRFGRALLRQIFRRRNSLRMNRPESVSRHPFSADLSSNELQTRALLTASVVSTACETSSVLPAPVRHPGVPSVDVTGAVSNCQGNYSGRSHRRRFATDFTDCWMWIGPFASTH